MLACLAVVWSYGITPLIDSERSGRGFTEAVVAQVPAAKELAFVGYKEQFFLYTDRPTVNFGHRALARGSAGSLRRRQMDQLRLPTAWR